MAERNVIVSDTTIPAPGCNIRAGVRAMLGKILTTQFPAPGMDETCLPVEGRCNYVYGLVDRNGKSRFTSAERV